MMRVAQMRVPGGAMARVPVEATALARRRSRIKVNCATVFEQPEGPPFTVRGSMASSPP
jgi:hypothetical protein